MGSSPIVCGSSTVGWTQLFPIWGVRAHSRTRGQDVLARTRRIAVTTLGWLLTVLGLAALVLPGPGLLALSAGLVLLSREYEWARRRMRPIKAMAFREAAKGVQNKRRIAASVLGAMMLIAAGAVWGIRPAAPEWWPWHHSWWLVGGWGTGATLMVSGACVIALLVYSYRTFGGRYRHAVRRHAAEEASAVRERVGAGAEPTA